MGKNGDNPAAENLTATLFSKDGWSGVRLGRYTIEEHLGAGGMGRVFLAEDVILKRKVALKVIQEDFQQARESGRLELFLREAQAVARLQHPNVVSVYDVVHKKGVVAIAMEYVAGGTLDDLVGKGKTLSVFETCRLGAEAAEGLACAHENGLIHSDVKPANLMLSKEKQCKVADFGVVRAMSGGPDLHEGKIVGTPYFVSPEVIRGENPCPASDIYALGIILWMALAGKPTYRAKSMKEMYLKHLHAPVPDIEKYCSDVPPSLKELIGACLHKDPDKRIADAAELAGRLRDISTEHERIAGSDLARISAVVGDTAISSPLGGSAPGGAGMPHARTGITTAVPAADVKARKRRLLLAAGAGAGLLVLVGSIVLIAGLAGGGRDGDGGNNTASADRLPPGAAMGSGAGDREDYYEPVQPAGASAGATAATRPATDLSADSFALSSDEPLGADDMVFFEIGDTGTLTWDDASINGNGAKHERQGDRRCIGSWKDTKTSVSWDGVLFKKAGLYEVTVVQAVGRAHNGKPGSEYFVAVGDRRIEGVAVDTGKWSNFKPVTLGGIRIDTPGKRRVLCRPLTVKGTGALNLREIRFRRLPEKNRASPDGRFLASCKCGSDTFDELDAPDDPGASYREGIKRFTWWDRHNTSEWIEWDFGGSGKRALSSVGVYWFAETAAVTTASVFCRPPKQWKLLYKKGDEWKEVRPLAGSPYGTKIDRLNVVRFEEIETTAIRIRADLQNNRSAGILRWRVNPKGGSGGKGTAVAAGKKGDEPQQAVPQNPYRHPAFEGNEYTASHEGDGSVFARLNRPGRPLSSADESMGRFSWYDKKGTGEWIERSFRNPVKIDTVKVYWFDDAVTCRPPVSWKLLYRDGGSWKEVVPANGSGCGVGSDQYNIVPFTPVETDGLRMEVTLQEGFSAGIIRWQVRAAR